MHQHSTLTIPEGCDKVLLHACCAPCSSAIVEWLLAHNIEPAIFYYNPNIWPRDEYEIRKNESKRHAESLNVKWIEADELSCNNQHDEAWLLYHQRWLQAIRGLEHEPERGRRCEHCFAIRLMATAAKASELSIPFFATTLASSRWKSLEQINRAGLQAEQFVNSQLATPDLSTLRTAPTTFSPVHFWAQNWRKDGLQDRRNALLKQYGFYNQRYCGCEFSAPAT